jgi:protein TonB
VTQHLKMASVDRDGAKVAGRPVRIPLRFALPEGWITTPDWARKPSAEAIANAIPQRAYDEGINGSALIACRVNLKGKLEDCVVEREEPEGVGFGAALLRMAPHFQMRPLMVDGKPVAGGRVRVPMEYKLRR